MLTIDANILVYALDRGEDQRRIIARDMIGRAASVASFLTQAAIGEFCNVTFRNRLLTAERIREQVEQWAIFFPIVPTSPEQLLTAAALAETRRKQFWDMVIVRVAADAGATVLITEDIGDGEVIAGVRIVNPFDPANAATLDALLTPSSRTG